MKDGPSLTSRELLALALLGRFRFLTRSQLQTLLFGANGPPSGLSAQTMAFRTLHSLRAKGLVERTSRSVGGASGGSAAHAWFLTARGARAVNEPRIAGLPRRLPPRGTFLLRHALAVADVAIAFERAASGHEGHRLLSFECDWEVAERLGPTVVVPDAYLVYETPLVELHAFVEADLGTAGSKFFARKVANYLALWRGRRWRDADGLWPTVLVVTPDQRRSSLLKRATEAVITGEPDADRVRAATEFAFAPLASITNEGPLARTWEVAGREGRHRLLDGEPL